MYRSIIDFKWRKSEAHWLLLSKFLYPQCPNFSKDWEKVLGESTKKAIKRFIKEGLIMLVNDLNVLMSHKYNINKLKVLLRKRKLIVSGRKDEIIKRLIQADSNGMKKATADLIILNCTQRGQKLVEQYLALKKSNRVQVEQQVMEYLKKRKFKKACLIVAAYESNQVFPRGIGIDWKRYNPDQKIEDLKFIFSNKPNIMANLRDEKLEVLRVAAAMMELWGENKAQKWLPAKFETGLPFDNDAAAMRMLSSVSYKDRIENFRMCGFKYVEVFAAEDSCDACKKLEGKIYKINEVPELPYEYCTHKKGCRCIVVVSNEN